jgi:hypothetical protein
MVVRRDTATMMVAMGFVVYFMCVVCVSGGHSLSRQTRQVQSFHSPTIKYFYDFVVESGLF